MRGAQLAAVALVAFVVVVVAAAVPGGVNGAIINHALLNLGGAMDVNRPTADPCNIGSAVVDLFAENAGVADEATVTSLTNAAGSGWALDSVTSTGPTYQQPGDCSGGNPNGCLVFGSGQDLYQGTETSTTWSNTLICSVFYYASTGTLRYGYAWADDAALTGSRNVFLRAAANDHRIFAGSYGLLDGDTDATTHVYCFDLTDPAAATLSVDGNVAADTDASGVDFRDPDRVVLGAYWNGTSVGTRQCTGCEFTRLLIWNEDPGLTADEMSSCIKDEMGI